ncbi:hypothetical protein [Acrocarpospora catenulata]|uniref:hypothetical protein n=1 Tax=Acrocarpospora catenulata TaxID=2836182 RepID=UPI002023B50D|nr:hypothetical protein [Acrocarpospora catenulata]
MQRKPGEECRLDDLVLSLRGSQQSYGAGLNPGFLLTVVNIGPVPCVVDLGPRALEMRVTSGGERVWSTADCVSGEGTDRQMLRLGVPYVRDIQWDRHHSGVDCTAKRQAAAKGTYAAVARVGTLRSARNVFELR